MAKTTKKHTAIQARKRRVRGVVRGTAARPRLSVFRSLEHISAQIIDDEAGRTLAAASDLKITKGSKMERAAEVGALVAAAAKKAKITQVVFDRNGCQYHGRVKAVAEAARAAGLKF